MLVSALIVLLIIVACGYVAFWFINEGLPEPMKLVAKIIVAVLGLIAIWQYVLPAVGLH